MFLCHPQNNNTIIKVVFIRFTRNITAPPIESRGGTDVIANEMQMKIRYLDGLAGGAHCVPKRILGVGGGDDCRSFLA